MKISGILAEIARERGLLVRPDGSLIGIVSDFPVLVKSIPYGNLNAIALTIRSGPGDLAALKKAVKGIKGLKASMLGSPGGGRLQYVVPYSIFKGRLKTTVISALDALPPAVRGHFAPPPGACEICNKPESGNLVVKGGAPALVCPSCAEAGRAKQQTERMAYEAQSPNYPAAILLGLIGAALGAVSWAAVIILVKSTYLLLAAGIGVMVAFFVKKAIGTVDRLGYGIAAVLVLASIFTGEILAYIWFIGRATGRLDVGMAYQAYMNILMNNPKNLIFTVIFALTGVWIGVATLGKMEKDTKADDLA